MNNIHQSENILACNQTSNQIPYLLDLAFSKRFSYKIKRRQIDRPMTITPRHLIFFFRRFWVWYKVLNKR